MMKPKLTQNNSDQDLDTKNIENVIAKCKAGLRESAISMQLRVVLNSGPSLIRGIYVFPVIGKIDEWQGIFFVHRGVYKGAILKYHIHFPPEYPVTPPKLVFQTELYHPLIDANGYFNFDQMQPKNPEEFDNTILNMLAYMKSSFSTATIVNLKEKLCPNPAAYNDFVNRKSSFEDMAAVTVIKSASDNVLYKNESNDPLKLSKALSESDFFDVRSKLLKALFNSPETSETKAPLT